ncbi:MAG: hypothetical protein WDO68_04430 [Gammaproteobacteria bacterium]
MQGAVRRIHSVEVGLGLPVFVRRLRRRPYLWAELAERRQWIPRLGKSGDLGHASFLLTPQLRVFPLEVSRVQAFVSRNLIEEFLCRATRERHSRNPLPPVL